MVSDRQLRNWYLKYNKLYWAGALPDNTILIWEPIPQCDGQTCPVFEVADNCFEVKIDPALKGVPGYWKIILLHECVHIALWRKHFRHQHGKVFKQEISRIFAKGAYNKLL